MPGTAAPAAVVVGEVWARAATTLPASIAAAAISLIPVIRASPVVANHHRRFVGTTDANLSGFLFGRRRVAAVKTRSATRWETKIHLGPRRLLILFLENDFETIPNMRDLI